MPSNMAIHKLTIRGFLSIQSLEELHLGNLKVLIGANGSGKSNFIAYFRMLNQLVNQRLQRWVAQQGGANRVLFNGVKQTQAVFSEIIFGHYRYQFMLEPSHEETLFFGEELLEDTSTGGLVVDGEVVIRGYLELGQTVVHTMGVGHHESRMSEQGYSMPRNIQDALTSWQVYHFHDTSPSATVKQAGSVQDSAYLREDAANLAPYLYQLQQRHPAIYEEIRQTVRLALPFFDDFVLRPDPFNGGEQVSLSWTQTDSDYPFSVHQLSDGALRFICLTTALLQPNPPFTLLIDEPELGLHPYALVLLGALMRTASQRVQVIVSTQSVPLLNEFTLDQVIVVERERGASVFRRLDEATFHEWLEDYTIGELWKKNVLGGRPTP